jgi:serine/threonine protein kinase
MVNIVLYLCLVIDLSKFEVVSLIGRGGFAKVMKVIYKANKKIYAMKIMSKLAIVKKKSTRSVINERRI